ncbi:DUF2490 domain-containing protein [Flavobacterium sp.]|uniref:DUF2490 domain-containing protein n=1 Tax=Flavobacterium sp. TaxID=239 RepID=UPI003752FC04
MQNFIIVILFLLTIFTNAQSNLGSWNIINVNMKVNSKWNFFTEAQLRSLSFYTEYHYYEVKAGATYKIANDFSATSGFGSYNTFSEGGDFREPIRNKEVRSWLQINLKNQLRFFTLEHRYRGEQRFTSNGYKNRFRYRLGGTLPINKKKIESKTFYISVWNELFFTNSEPFFERNRLFLGCGYEANKNLAIQTGYIYQFDYKINDETGRDFLNIALLYNFDLSKKDEKEFIPTTSD